MYRRVIQKIKECNLDAYLIQNEGNRNFICSKENYFFPGIILVTGKEVFLAVSSRNINYIRTLYPEYTVLFGGLAEIAQLCKKEHIKYIGYESATITNAVLNRMEELFKSCVLVKEPQFIEDIRMMKTPQEIAFLKAATEVSDKAYTEFLNHLRVGMTEKQARAKFDDILRVYGADEFSFPTLLSSGARAFMPHSAPTDKIINTGELVLMDYGIVLNGYCSDTSRTVVMGRADDTQKKLYNLVLKAQNHALDNIKAGMTCREADALARDIIVAEMDEGCFDYGLGHGVGMQVHEKPYFYPNSDYILKENTVMSVEPGIYIEGWGGIRIEDIMVVEQKKGGRNLTTAPKDALLEI